MVVERVPGAVGQTWCWGGEDMELEEGRPGAGAGETLWRRERNGC